MRLELVVVRPIPVLDDSKSLACVEGEGRRGGWLDKD